MTGLGSPYPFAGVAVPTFAVEVRAIAASIVFVPPLKSISWYAASVPMRSPGSLPPSTSPGEMIGSPMLAVLTPAKTWLFESAYVFVPFVTRTPSVPVATPARPAETPIGTGRG